MRFNASFARIIILKTPADTNLDQVRDQFEEPSESINENNSLALVGGIS